MQLVCGYREDLVTAAKEVTNLHLLQHRGHIFSSALHAVGSQKMKAQLGGALVVIQKGARNDAPPSLGTQVADWRFHGRYEPLISAEVVPYGPLPCARLLVDESHNATLHRECRAVPTANAVYLARNGGRDDQLRNQERYFHM
jgi:hypothetical protein